MHKGRTSRRHLVLNRPTSVEGLSFEDLYEELSDNWQEKSRRLQARRWRKIKHQTV